MNREAMARSTIGSVLEGQRSWAYDQNISLDPAAQRLADPGTALFQPLSESTRAALAAGKGDELSRLHHLRSSTALAINVFHAWREDPDAIARALGAPGSYRSIDFERTMSTGLGGTSPHLDVVVNGSPLIAIECKFLETYDVRRKQHPPFRPSYFTTPGLWDRIPAALRLATAIEDGSQNFELLNAPQLLKHALGLSAQHGSDFSLFLVWYRANDDSAADEEIEQFASAVGSDIDFTAITYQELVKRLNEESEPAVGYFDYLEHRYRLGSL